ncbi:hypothetical protein [Streptomyces sp. NPDC056527]|uniref:hypothetical protein n=1 Tax=Streptomyces sp. NPDC056527 TaxID=3345853 RepID=UPI0036921B3E
MPNRIGTEGDSMRHGLIAATAALLVAALTGCSGGGHPSDRAPSTSPVPSAPASSAAEPSRAEVADLTRAHLAESLHFEADAAGPGGLMLVDAWPNGVAAYAWETGDERLCHATVGVDAVRTQGCATKPNDPPLKKSGGITPLFTSFAHGWSRIFAADHVEVTDATCSGAPLEVIRIGTVADGARTLYAVWFSDYTKGEILLTLRHNTRTSQASLRLDEAGDRACTPQAS